MKKLVLSEILLLSMLEKKAKRISFDPNRTVILGTNNTGKSVLIKSIYSAFGALPSKIHPKWKQAEVVILVKFIIDGKPYAILNDHQTYTIFDDNNNAIAKFKSISKGLAPFFSSIFDFKVKLTNRSGLSEIPPPAFLFLPYYTDQDNGWVENWNSFARLGQFSHWRNNIVHYHTGIKPNEYYEIKGNIDEVMKRITTSQEEYRIMKSISEKTQKDITSLNVNIDMDEFRNEINELLLECERLKVVQDKLKNELVELGNSKSTIENQIKIAESILKEVSADYRFADEKLENVVECPLCRAQYDNSFKERFQIAQDEDRCFELIQQLRNDLSDIEDKIQVHRENYQKSYSEFQKIQSILETKKGEIKLRDLINNEGRKELKSIFVNSLDKIYELLARDKTILDDLRVKLKAFDDKERKEMIVGRYLDYMQKFLYELDVSTYPENAYRDIACKISEQGSTFVRATIAYYFSILHIMREYTSSAYCPIIMDSPNQQAQDRINLPRVLEFIKNNQPNNSQMILGLEDTKNVDFGCKIIELKTKFSLLQADEYSHVFNMLKPFLNQSIHYPTSV